MPSQNIPSYYGLSRLQTWNVHLPANISSFLIPSQLPASLCHESHNFSRFRSRILRGRLLVFIIYPYTPLTILLFVMERFGPNILFFFYLVFFWFYISFSFSFRTMKKARDKEVTWQVTWCDIISLELDGRVWKMTSGHLEYIWWPWVEHEAGMRMKHGHKGRVI